ncbi:MAG: KamA family radical SAM protein [Kiritimatiellaeota bacterium]|nr:KamA family radical SAM protein [Kiritimatiellota bacterium]
MKSFEAARNTIRGNAGPVWRRQMAAAVRNWEALAAALRLCPEEIDARRNAAQRYPVLVSPYYLSLARSTSLDDPILRQCVPAPAEVLPRPSQTPDPLDEDRATPVPGLIHRYPDRVLLLMNSRCAVHCRHCFRKRLWRAPLPDMTEERLDRALAYIGRCTAVREVILSGGDPLLAPDADIRDILDRLGSLDNIEIVRIGTRLPVVLPCRFTPEFCALLGHRRLPVWVVTHFNHPWEVTEESATACTNLTCAGIPVLNQTVLLRGVNDRAETIRALCTELLKCRVKPYYLLMADPAEGAMHFRTSLAAARGILHALRGRLSGLAVPNLAADLPNGGGKVVLEPCPEHPPSRPGGPPRFTNFRGRVLPFPG